MSSDSIKRLDTARNYYKSIQKVQSTEYGSDLEDIKSELKILNDENAYKTTVITNATGSPYLPDQNFYNKNVVYNSDEETSWKEVKSYDQLYNKSTNFNLKKLNII